MRKGKYHTRRILNSIRVRALSAAFAFVLIGVVPSFFNVGYDRAKAAYIHTVDTDLTQIPMPHKSTFEQVSNISKDRFSPLTQSFNIIENHNSWYETKYQKKTLTVSHDDDVLNVKDVLLDRDELDEDYYILNNELLTGSRIIFTVNNTISGARGSDYYSTWNQNGKVKFYTSSTEKVITNYSKVLSNESKSSFDLCDLEDEVLDIRYDDDNLYGIKNMSIEDFDEYNSSYLWEKNNLELECIDSEIKDEAQVKVSPVVSGDALDLKIKDNCLIYNPVMTGYGTVIATENNTPSSYFVKKSDLDVYKLPSIDDYESFSKDTFDKACDQYAIATVMLPMTREYYTGTGSTNINRTEFNCKTGLFWDGTDFYAMSWVPTCYADVNGYFTNTNSYSFRYKLNYSKVNPSETMAFSGPVTYEYKDMTKIADIKYEHLYNENNKKELALKYSTTVKYYDTCPEYYYCYEETNKMGELVPYEDNYEHIVYLDKKEPTLNLDGVEGKKIINAGKNINYRVSYESLVLKDNQYISAVLYNKDNLDKPYMYGRLCKPVEENGEFTFRLPEQIENGDYILGFFTEILDGCDADNKYMDYMSRPVFCELNVGDETEVEIETDDDDAKYERTGSLINPLHARDKYGIWWNYTSVKKYVNEEFVDEYIDRLWMPYEHKVFTEAINQALEDPNSMNGKLVLPSYLSEKKLPVKGIGGGTRETVVIPEEITGFSEIIFPEYLERVNDYAFYECDANYELNLASSISYIGKYAFSYNKISELYAEGKQLTIDSYAFMQNSFLQSVYLNYTDSLKIGYRSFFQCKNIRQQNENPAMFLSAPTLLIERQAFASSMQHNMGAYTTIASKNGKIGAEAFKNTMNYTDKLYSSRLNLQGFNGVIEANAFNGASGINSLYIPNGVTLEEYAFNNLSSITQLQCDASVVSDYSFSNCPQIVDIILGEHVARVCPKWMGCNISKIIIPEVNIAILGSNTKLEFATENDEIYSSFGAALTTSGLSRDIDTVNLFYNSSNIAQSAQMKNGIISDNINALNMANVEYNNIYKAGDCIKNIIWIPSEKFTQECFGSKVFNGELGYIPDDKITSFKNIYVIYNGNNKAMNNTELKKDLFKIYCDENLQDEFEGEWLFLPRIIYKNLNKETKYNYEALLNLPDVNQVTLADKAIDITIVGLLNNEIYKGNVSILGLTATEALEDEFGSIDDVYDRITSGEEALNRLEKVNKQLNDSIDQIASLNSDIEKSNEEIARLAEEIKEKNQEIERIKAASTGTTADIIALQEEAESKNQEIQKLNEAISAKTSELEKVSKQASTYSDRIDELNKIIDEYVITISDKDNDINSYIERIDLLQKENTELKNKLDSANNNSSNESNNKEDEDGSFDEYSNEILRLTAELNLAKKEVLSSKNEYNLLKDATSNLEKENLELKNSVTTLQKEYKSLIFDSQDLEKENNSLKTNADALKKENSTLKANTTVLEKENSTLKANTTVLENENNTLKSDVLVLEKQNKSLQEKSQNLEKEKQELGISNDKLGEDISNLNSENQKLKNQKTNLQNNLNELKEKNSEIKNDYEEYTNVEKNQEDDDKLSEVEDEEITTEDRIYYTGVDSDGNSYSYYITDEGEIIYDDGIINDSCDDEEKLQYPLVLPTDITAEDVSYSNKSDNILEDLEELDDNKNELIDATIMGDNDAKDSSTDVPVGKIILGVILVSGAISAVVIIGKRRKAAKNTAKK